MSLSSRGFRASFEGQCAGKHRFETSSQTERVKRRMRRKGETVVSYRCAHCNGFHLAHPLPKPAEKRSPRAAAKNWREWVCVSEDDDDDDGTVP